MLFKEIAPLVILLTLMTSAIIVIRTKSSNLSTIDGVIAILGTILGLLITFLNLIFSNNYLITIGPIITFASLLYLRYRTKLLADDIDLDLHLNARALKIIQTIYWICIFIALINDYQAENYYRTPLFFFSISIAVSSLGVEILSRTYEKNLHLYELISKIIIVSFILRFSAYFISPYPIGSDPWEHAALIKDISIYGTSYLPQIHDYYSNYPLMHIYASNASLLGNLTTKDAMSIIGVVLTFSTIFVYLYIKKITNDVRLALFSMLLLNFSDFHIQWSIQIISMSFGIAIYTMAIYFLIEQKERISIQYKVLTALSICILIWIHTISSFILLVSLISLYVGSCIYGRIYITKNNSPKLIVNITLCMFTLVVLSYHWMDPKFPFLDGMIAGLADSLLNKAEFLGRDTISNMGDSWASIFNIVGFLILIFFGVIGSLHSLSKENQTKTKVCLVFMMVILFSIFFIFPVMGIRNIVPYRWPAFIYITLVFFSGIGILKVVSIVRSRHYKVVFVYVLLVIFTFFMITNSFTNMDSPIYGKNLNQKIIWTESEMEMFTNLNNSYDGIIFSDLQTRQMPFQKYIKRDRVADYLATSDGRLDWGYMRDKMLVWRKNSLDRPVQVNGFENSDILLGFTFKHYLDNNYDNIYDTGNAKAYLGHNE